MKKLGKLLLTILEVVIIVYVIFVTACLLNKNKYGYTMFGDKTLVIVNKGNSAELNLFSKGDLVVINGVLFDEVNVGDTLYYYDTVNNTYVLRKGIVKEKTGDNFSAVYVMGDSKSISSERIVGVYSNTKYSTLGRVLEVLESRLGFLLIVILPVFVLFIYQIYKMVMLVKFSEVEIEKPVKTSKRKQVKEKIIETEVTEEKQDKE